MFGFLKSWASSVGKPMWIEAFHLDTPIKLPSKVETPLGSKVSVVTLCVDVQYEMLEKQIVVKQVRLSRGTEFGGTGQKVNVCAERVGEAWYASSLPISQADLMKTVQNEITPAGANLRRMMIGKWLDTNAASIAAPAIDAINARRSAAEIEALIKDAGRSHEVTFMYDSPEKGPERRSVVLRGASGDSIKTTDLKDGQSKKFRIDRITDVRFSR
jgi:hypothetical protein